MVVDCNVIHLVDYFSHHVRLYHKGLRPGRCSAANGCRRRKEHMMCPSKHVPLFGFITRKNNLRQQLIPPPSFPLGNKVHDKRNKTGDQRPMPKSTSEHRSVTPRRHREYAQDGANIIAPDSTMNIHLGCMAKLWMHPHAPPIHYR